MKTTFAVSGQHYLFDVQVFAHTILAMGGESYHYALRDRTTRGVIEDVAAGKSELGVLMMTAATRPVLEEALEERGLVFTPVAEGAPCVALPNSHPLSNAKQLYLDDLSDWPYLYFEQEEDAPAAFFEECFGDVPRSKSIALTDRASLSELAAAVNGYTITSGILVGIADGSSLTTVPLESNATITLGYIAKKDVEMDLAGQRFVDILAKQLERYMR